MGGWGRVAADYGELMDKLAAQVWLDRYVAAWMSYEPGAIGDLFSEDVSYRYHPYDDPVLGRAAVVASWLGESGSDDASTRDDPGTYEATYSPVAVDGDVLSPPGGRGIASIVAGRWSACSRTAS